MKKFISTCVLLLTLVITTIAQGTWTRKADFPGSPRSRGVRFVISNQVYYGSGNINGGNPENSDFYKYDVASDTWTAVANLPQGMQAGIGFSINGKGYAGIGWVNGNAFTNFYEYDPVSNTWTSKASWTGPLTNDANSFVINGKGYVGGGGIPYSNNSISDFYEFDPITNSWTQKSNIPVGRRNAGTFTIGNLGFLGCGYNPLVNDFYKYDPINNLWTAIANFPVATTSRNCGFSINGYGYSTDNSFLNQIYKYDPALNTWTHINVPVNINFDADFAEVINGKAYFSRTSSNEFWEWDPNGGCIIPVAHINANDTISYCSSSIFTLYSDSCTGCAYQWKKNNINITGANNPSLNITTTGNYKVIVNNSCGSNTSNIVNVKRNITPSITISPSTPVTICNNGSVTFTATSNTSSFSWIWYKNNVIISGATSSTYTASTNGKYKVNVTNTVSGCSRTSAAIQITKQNFTASITSTGTITCNNDILFTLNTNATSATYQWKKDNMNIMGATSLTYQTKDAGKYLCIVTSNIGCTKVSNTITLENNCREISDAPNEIDKDIAIYPNPANTEIIIGRTNDAKCSIEIINNAGQVVKRLSSSLENTPVSISNLSAGVYFVKIDDGEKMVRKKITVIR